MPVFHKLRAEGKIRALGITERFVEDPMHTMLQQSLEDNCWDVIMVGFNLLIPSARRNIFPLAKKQGVGVIGMHAARSGLSHPARLKATCQHLVEKGFVPSEALNSDDPLGFIIGDGGALTVPEAAYRFCHPGQALRIQLNLLISSLLVPLMACSASECHQAA